jgi:hypothetical protein
VKDNDNNNNNNNTVSTFLNATEATLRIIITLIWVGITVVGRGS